MKRIFLDSDIILDALLKRPPFVLYAVNILKLATHGDLIALTSSIAFLNVNYFLEKFDRANNIPLLKSLRSMVTIIEVGETIIDTALKSNFNDFEDAIQ